MVNLTRNFLSILWILAILAFILSIRQISIVGKICIRVSNFSLLHTNDVIREASH